MMRARGELLARLRIRTCQNRVHDGRDSQDNDLRCAPKRRNEPEQSMAPQGAMHAIMKIWRMMCTHGGRARPMGASERRAAALLSLQHHADAEAPAAGASPALDCD